MLALRIEKGSGYSFCENDHGIEVVLPEGFDFVIDQNVVRQLRSYTYRSVALDFDGTLQDRFIHHVLVMLSFLTISGDVTGQLGSLTDIVRELRFDFHRHHPDVDQLSEVEQNRIRKNIHAHYINAVVQNDYLVPRKPNSQKEVRERFASVGVVNDLIVRSPKLSGNENWTYNVTDDGQIVRSRDIRLVFSKFLASLPNAESYLEVGAGSGFCTLFLRHYGKACTGSELSPYRVAGARLFSDLVGIPANFEVGDLSKLQYQDNSFDVVFSCFVLEQCDEILETAIEEVVRVARKWCVFLEPTTDFNTTLPGLIHIEMSGQPVRFFDVLKRSGYAVDLVRPRLSHYYNPGCIYILDVTRRT